MKVTSEVLTSFDGWSSILEKANLKSKAAFKEATVKTAKEFNTLLVKSVSVIL